MNCRLPMRIGGGGGSAAPTPIAVTITGTGNTTYCYATIGGTKRYGAGTYEVMAGDKITFGVYGRSTSYTGKVTIDGTDVLSVTNQTTKTYEWTVPDGISAIAIAMTYTSSSYQRRGTITVTTTKSSGGGGGGDGSLDYHDNFADNDWATIAKVCAEGLVPTTWKVGDQKAMTINGASYPIDIIGIQHDDFASGGKAPFTFQLHDCYNTSYAMNSSNTNSGGWNNSAMRKTHLPAILALMPNDVQAGIKEVNKKTSAGNRSSTINTTADKLFLLSEIEIFGNVTYTFSGEGSQYAYYSAGNSKVKNKSSRATRWFTRSPVNGNSTHFCVVSNAGAAGNDYASTGSDGVAPAFCFGNPVSGGGSGGGGGDTARTVKITDSGDYFWYFEDYGRVLLGETEITAEGTYVVANNTGLRLVLPDDGETWIITVNGQEVERAASVDYTFNITADTNVAIVYNSSSMVCTWNITTS